MIYLDNAATTFIKPESVYAEMLRAMRRSASPGRGSHRYAMEAADTVFRCREKVSGLFSVRDPENIVFTFNATHALNIAIRSLVSCGDKVVISGYEHNSVTRPLCAVGADVKAVGSRIFDRNELLSGFYNNITRDTKAVVCTHVSNVFGNILPIGEISEICREKSVPLVIDASQSAGALDIDAEKLQARFIAMPGHKGLYGPQGTGILICGEGAVPVLYGGTGSDSLSCEMPSYLPDRLEAGTHNVPGIAGLSAGIDFVLKTGTGCIMRHERSLISELKEGLEKMDGITVYGGDSRYQAGVLSFRIEGVSPEKAGEMLSCYGAAVRTGLHCAPLAHKTASTLETGTIRASVSAFTTRRDIAALIKYVAKIRDAGEILSKTEKTGAINNFFTHDS